MQTENEGVSVEDLVFAITSVTAASAAARGQGDLKTVAVLSKFYALVAENVSSSDGRVVKVMGDGVLVVFPAARARQAAEALRLVQSSGTALWSAFDARCRVQVRAGAGRLACGAMGPPGEQRFDVYGTPLNDLFKLPSGDFVTTSELASLLS